MDIASLSSRMAQSSLKLEVGTSVMKLAKDQATIEGEALIKMMEQSVLTNLGGNLDIKA